MGGIVIVGKKHMIDQKVKIITECNVRQVITVDHGKIRKLSVTISLNDPSEYDGGNLQFDFRQDHDWLKEIEKVILRLVQKLDQEVQ